jgi:chromosome partitioning protein
MSQQEAILISLFNHKGGVSKTTTTFNLGWALASAGKKVLMVDCDSQCNLTGMVLNFNDEEDFQHFYNENPKSNLSACLNPAFQGTQSLLEPAKIVPVNGQNSNLFLLAGHLDVSESEAQLAIALQTGSAIPALTNLPGSLRYLLKITAKENNIDVVLIDMSPSVGALNQCLLMGSDYFIVPTFPDYFCTQAVISLSRIVPKWNESIVFFRNLGLIYPLPITPPKFIGTISQRYRPRNGNPAASFDKWINRIKETVDDKLVPALSNIGMIISRDNVDDCDPSDTPYNLASIPDFNSLIAKSQTYNVPVFALTDTQLELSGHALNTMKASRNNFDNIFRELANTIIKLTNL